MSEFRTFNVFKLAVNLGNECREIESLNLPWVYDQDRQSGFCATMKVVPIEDAMKIANQK